jgi:hypothetical protein
VQAHGARIFAQSTLGSGAEFILEILHARAAAVEPDDVPLNQEVSHG